MKHTKWSTWTHWKNLIFNVVFLMFLTGCQPAISSQSFTAEVRHIVSGREFEVAGAAAAPDVTERIRLEGIDLPDVGQQPWGEAAKNQLEQRLHHQTVLLETDAEPRDAIGRRLAYVWQNGILLNESLVADGYAVIMPHPPNSKYDQRFAHAQEHARVLGLGLWKPEQPMRVSPAEFRSRNGEWGVGSKNQER